ncbi:MAG: VWA domain-containing protein [Spirochaetales bacterium]|nr:VWA domain-containing protein [Spirochaetales bacterium]
MSLLLYIVVFSFFSCAGSSQTLLEGPREEKPAAEQEEQEQQEGATGPTAETIAETDTGVTGETGSAEEQMTPAPEAQPDAQPDAQIIGEGEAQVRMKTVFSGDLSQTAGGPDESGLRAGFSDDNKQYNSYLDFLDEYASVPHRDMDVSERIIIRVQDRDGKPAAGAGIDVYAGGNRLVRGRTTADGSYRFFPSQYQDYLQKYLIRVRGAGVSLQDLLERSGPRERVISLPVRRRVPEPLPVDICFVMDTTGSMGEEIRRLKQTIELIYRNLSGLEVPTRVRFGMVLYRDVGDRYRTQRILFTDDLDVFANALSQIEAEGGGDYPEDLEKALEVAVTRMDWSDEGIKLAYTITDAPPKLDYQDTVPYTRTAAEAAGRGIKLYGVGTGGLNAAGEYALRQIAQYTGGAYIFLAYGEQGESEGGKVGSVSHHTGTNYQTDRLEAIIIRFSRKEISYQSDRPLNEGEDFFTAEKVDSESREETLSELFGELLDQVVDSSSLNIGPDMPVAVLPVRPAGGASNTGSSGTAAALNAEYFTERLLFAVSRHERLQPAERQDLQSLFEEIENQLRLDQFSTRVAGIGDMLGADLLLQGTLYSREEGYEIFIRLWRAATGEVLSESRAVIDVELGL